MSLDAVRDRLIRRLPKVELHLHIEGTLEPEMMFALAERNRVELPFFTVDEVRAAYEFDDLQSFLDIYYRGASVLVEQRDFAELMGAYLERAIADGVRRTEVFFDPQTHTARGVDIGTVIEGLASGQAAFADRISSSLILCFLRHLPADEAMTTLRDALPYRDRFDGVGLDSSEVGYPPELFTDVYELARENGLRRVAHGGEEGPPAYVRGALDALGAERIDHGVRAEEDDELLERIISGKVPLTMCPLSNQKLQVFPDLSEHNLKRLLDRGVRVSINSDDPAYFGGYVLDNYVALVEALDLERDDVVRIAKNSVESTFLDYSQKATLLAEIDAYVATH